MHLYVHVPFCIRRCSYCDFSIAVRKRIPTREYLDAVLTELRRVGSPAAMPRGTSEVDTVYLGGGTPSLLPPDAIAALVQELAQTFRVPHSAFRIAEITLEANPEDVTPAAARAWVAAGINRVSLGAQSFDDRVLEWMHRSHDAARIGDAVRTLRTVGLDNISLDLIFGLPDELQRDWNRDLDALCSLRPAHCSLYGLTVEPRTPLERWISRGAIGQPNEGRYVDEYLEAHRRLSAIGYRFYEVSNAALPGCESRHNSAYWRGVPYVGLGPAAHSFDGRVRRWNLSAWEAYRRAIATGRSPVEAEEVLTDDQLDLERTYLGLRTSDGILLRSSPPPSAVQWQQRGWVVRQDGRLRCTPDGWLRLDALVRDLTAHEVRS